MFAQKSNNDSSIFHQLTPVAYLLIEMSTENQALRAKYVKQNLGELEGEIYKFWIPPPLNNRAKEKIILEKKLSTIIPISRTKSKFIHYSTQIQQNLTKKKKKIPSSYKTYTKNNPYPGSKEKPPNLNKFKRTAILQSWLAVMKSN